MQEHYPFKAFLSNSWWFLLLVFVKVINQSEKESAFGSTFLDIVFFGGIVILLMYVYWFVRYGRKSINKIIK
jgi:hypothetical protein